MKLVPVLLCFPLDNIGDVVYTSFIKQTQTNETTRRGYAGVMMNNDISFETKISRDDLADLIAENYTQEELLNLIIYVIQKQGNEVAVAASLAANLELFANG